ncbi:MAG: hypothetical protein WBY69_23510 [Candidatus Acidiferrales bacterium]
MPPSSQDSIVAIQPELLSGETIVWAGQPNTRVIFHKQDLYMVPFSLLWGGFAVFWEASVAGLWGSNGKPGTPWSFGMVWGIPFVVAGQYFIWGRFFYDAWLKRRTYYALTNRRVIAVQNGWSRRMASSYLDSLPNLVKEDGANGVGTLRFNQSDLLSSKQRQLAAWNALSVGDVPTFVDVEDVDSIYRLISDGRDRTRSAKVAS